MITFIKLNSIISYSIDTSIFFVNYFSQYNIFKASLIGLLIMIYVFLGVKYKPYKLE